MKHTKGTWYANTSGNQPLIHTEETGKSIAVCYYQPNRGRNGGQRPPDSRSAGTTGGIKGHDSMDKHNS